ncbi:MAG: hypothetical protein CMN54_07220 [SAR324 cluster bacterium]|uniref:Methyl-accepting transducer domain-containing protein n=1 Tax=SAR324 cluster bacterium TaxID=2024889 RepID=A0A2D6YJ67_9DELT|nr:hypothetical protein [SAR324 cluster bacterium]
MTVSMRGLLNWGGYVLALLILLGGELFLRREMLLSLEESSLDQATLEKLYELSATHELWLIILVGILALLSVLIFWNTSSASRPLKVMVEELLNTSSQLRKASEQVAKNSAELSNDSMQQATSGELASNVMHEIALPSIAVFSSSSIQVAEQIEDINALARSVEENTRRTLELSAEARAAAESGVQAMSEISSAMRGVQEGSTRITDIIEVIDTITHQTKMLATNAAIEAARAGEQGKGFAVVADEVSKLAENSKKAAREIGELIRESVTKARDGGKLAADGEAALQNILQTVVEVVDLVSDVALSASEQTDKMREAERLIIEIKQASTDQNKHTPELATAIQDMIKVAQKSAMNAESGTVAAEQLFAQVLILSDLVDRLATQIGTSKTSEVTPIQTLKPKKEAANSARLLPAPAKKAGATKFNPESKRPPTMKATTLNINPSKPKSDPQSKPSDIIPMRDDFSEF